jgi:short-subunit dehydrogenase
VVTGCTAGIGEEITYRLARSGAVNLVLIGRSMEKLRRVETKCKEINRKVQVRVIQADLCKEALQISKYEEISRQC